MLTNYYLSTLSANQQVVYYELLNGIKNKIKKIKISEKIDTTILETVSREHPELYYCDFSKINIEDGVFGRYVLINYLNYNFESRIQGKIKKILYTLPSLNTEIKIRFIHNHFIRHICYDDNNLLLTENHNIIGPLINGKGVCEGISKAAQYILDSLKIDNAVVQGTLENESHMWNVVSINGNNYHLDITSDISLTESKWNKPGYFYYLLTDSEIKKTHCFSEKFDCFQTSDNPFYKTNRVFYDDVSLINFIRTVTRNQRMIYFKYLGTKNSNEVLKLVADNLKLFNIFTRLNMKEKLGTYYIWY